MIVSVIFYAEKMLFRRDSRKEPLIAMASLDDSRFEIFHRTDAGQ